MLGAIAMVSSFVFPCGQSGGYSRLLWGFGHVGGVMVSCGRFWGWLACVVIPLAIYGCYFFGLCGMNSSSVEVF